MVYLIQLDEIARKIKDDRETLFAIEESLSEVNKKLHEIPLKSATESAFAKMIGSSYDDKIQELQNQKSELLNQKQIFNSTIQSDLKSFIDGFSSSDLVLPLDPEPKHIEGKTIFKFKDNQNYKNALNLLGELLGLSSPIVVKEVMFSPSEVVIAVKDDFEAKQKFIESLKEVQNTLMIKKKN